MEDSPLNVNSKPFWRLSFSISLVFFFIYSVPGCPLCCPTSPHNRRTHILIFFRSARLSSARSSLGTGPTQVVRPHHRPQSPGSSSPPNALCGLLLFMCYHEPALLCSRELHVGFVGVSAAPNLWHLFSLDTVHGLYPHPGTWACQRPPARPADAFLSSLLLSQTARMVPKLLL